MGKLPAAFFTKGKLLMSPRFRTILNSLAAVSFISVAVASSAADDRLSSAAGLFRDKEYQAAYALVEKSIESPQRSFLQGVAALRAGKPEEALLPLAAAEQKLPLLADYAVLYQAEALLSLKKYPEAAAKAASIGRLYPASLLLRRSEKLYADALFESGDYPGALKAFQGFVEKYATGSDAIDAVFQGAGCREKLGNNSGAIQSYRNLWINNPATSQARKSRERIRELEKQGLKAAPYTVDELLKRASYLYSQNEFTAALETLELITVKDQTPPVAARIDLRTGLARYKLRQYKLAEKHLLRASTSSLAGISSEARFWLAKTLERQNQNERALALYGALATEGKQQEFADDALMEAAGLKRALGQYLEAARLFEQSAKLCPDTKVASRALWEAGWSFYLAGNYIAAVDIFKTLLKDEAQREKVLYWLGRSLENVGNIESAASWYRMLYDEYPAGFYACWYREQKGIKDTREALGGRNALAELPLPAGFEKPRLLASLGMLEEARNEMRVARKKAGDKKNSFSGLSRIYLEMADYSSAISLFMQNLPMAWEKGTLPLWTAGYPLAYNGLVARYAAENGLSEGLVYALIRAESGFRPAVKSPAGAIGLMQMMPATAKQTAREKGTFDPQRLTSPEYNIRLGTRHLRDLMKGYDGDAIYVAAAYNAGSGALERWRKKLAGLKKDEFIESIPYQETRDYVKKVYAAAATYRQLYGVR